MENKSTEWNEADLIMLVSQRVEESLTLDYKHSDALMNTDGKKNEISKDVSALANSAGGILVYGIKETNHAAIEVDGGRDAGETTKEWLEHVINSRIRPRIPALHINPVRLSTGRVAYVITVPQGVTAHQAFDKRYYKRFNSESCPMEDHEIRDVMNRLKFPLLVPAFSPRLVEQKGAAFEYALNICLMNKGAMAAHHWKLVVCIPVALSLKVKGFGKQETVQVESNVYGKPWYKQAFRADHVIFPDDEWSPTENGSIEFVYKIDTGRYDRNEAGEPFVLWTTYADHMPAQNGNVFFSQFRTT